MAAVHPRTSPFASDDREFLLILAACSLGYALLVAALSFVPTPSRSTTDVASLPPRIAKLVLQAPPPTPAKRVVPAPEAASPSEAPVAPKPKAGTSAKKVAPAPPPAPPSEAETPVDTEAALAEARLRLEAEAAAARERNRAVAKQSGLLKALAGGTGGASPGGNPAALDRVLSDISVLSNPALPPTGQGGGGPGLGGTAQHGLGGSGSGGVGGGGVSVEDVIAGLKGQGTGDAVVLAGRGSARVESALVVKGAGPTRSEESILRVLKGLNAWLKFQYHKAQRDQPALGSSITIEFTITPQGEVTDCRVSSSALNHPTLEDTILKRFCLLKFPPLEEGADDEVTVKYPIDFEGFS